MLQAWVAAGFDPDAFWSKTYRELTIIFGGVADRIYAQQLQDAWSAWNTANLIKADPKKFPSWKRFRPRRQTGRVEMPIAEQYKAFKAWAEGEK